MQERIKAVISYEDDVYVWVYIDQIDRVLRYESYVIDYDDHGCPTTLKLVIEEGVLDNLHEVPLLRDLLYNYYDNVVYAPVQLLHAYSFTAEGLLVATAPLLFFFNSLTSEQLSQVHSYFAEQEVVLKREKKTRWVRSLRALGFDVVPSL